MRSALTAFVVLLSCAACASNSHPQKRLSPEQAARLGLPPSCTRSPPSAGDCIKGQLKAHGYRVTPPTLGVTHGSPCYDISQWQGLGLRWRNSGAACVIVQTNDGQLNNPFFWIQARELNEAHIPWGTYTFLACYPGNLQADHSNFQAHGLGRKLGMWADAETGCGYREACSYVHEARLLAHIYGVYGSPGTYSGGFCGGRLWPAEWGTGPAYPFSGWPASAVVIRQWCGTCFFQGTEIDRDEDLGLIGLASPPAPAPSPSQLRAKLREHRLHLHRLEAQRVHLRHKLARYGCARRIHEHVRLGPKCSGWRAAGARVNRDVRLEGRIVRRIERSLR